MRTTLTLDQDVAARIQQVVRRSGKTLKDVVNEALRHGLGLTAQPVQPRPFKVRPHTFGFKPGIDPDRLNQLVDELEADEQARKLSR